MKQLDQLEKQALEQKAVNFHPQSRQNKREIDHDASPIHKRARKNERATLSETDSLATNQAHTRKKTSPVDIPISANSNTATSAESTELLSNIYSKGKALFQRGSRSISVVGREKERAIIQEFLTSRLEVRGKGSLYISGLPGTGKSALLTEVVMNTIKEKQVKYPIRLANINCMTVEHPKQIFEMIHKELVASVYGKHKQVNEYESEEDSDDDDSVLASSNQVRKEKIYEIYLHELDRIFTRGNKHKNQQLGDRHIVILDELDSIMTKDQEIIFRLFQLAFAKNSSLILVGIANALDLTDRFLPRLRSSSLTPQLLQFLPYTDTQISNIITSRLWKLADEKQAIEFQKVNRIPLMDKAAISLCAKKTASNTGDLRRAFDICRQALEMVEEDVRRKFYLQEEEAQQIQVDPSLTPSTENEDKNSNGILKLSKASLADAKWKRAIISDTNARKVASLTLENAPRVTISHIAQVCAACFGGTTANRLKMLNLQQKAVLCTIASAESDPSVSAKLTVSKVYDYYVVACNIEKDINPLVYNDYLEVILALDSYGVIAINGISGRKGLGSKTGKSTNLGSGSGCISDDIGQRRLNCRVNVKVLKTTLSAIPILQPFLKF